MLNSGYSSINLFGEPRNFTRWRSPNKLASSSARFRAAALLRRATSDPPSLYDKWYSSAEAVPRIMHAVKVVKIEGGYHVNLHGQV
jgi:hypothetical protein